MFRKLIHLLILVGVAFEFCDGAAIHQQVHLSLGSNENEMLVTWVTMKPVADQTLVEYRISGHPKMDQSVKAESTHFRADGADFITHRALLTNLTPETAYDYQVGSPGSGWSSIFHFKSLPSNSKSWNPRFAIYGDLGFQNEESLPFLSKDVEKEMYDVIFHIGDFAYDFYERNGEQGHDFMRSIEKVASRVPYLTCPGNHEQKSNFSHYDARFSMFSHHQSVPTSPLTSRLNNHFYSLDLGPVHFLVYSTEFYYFTEYGWDQIERQYAFLEENLKRAHANRARVPWIITLAHRPLYCITQLDKSCDYSGPALDRPKLRSGIHIRSGPKAQFGLEEMFMKYGVDMQFAGHEHAYGRLLPVFNGSVVAGKKGEGLYEDSMAPVIVVTGSAGNRQQHSTFVTSPKPWLSTHFVDYGYTRLTVKDRLHLVLEQVSDPKGGTVQDRVDITKTADMPRWLVKK